MANKGETKIFKINRAKNVSGIEKTSRFIYKAKAGKHNSSKAISSGYLLKNVLFFADNNKEVVYIINNREMLIDGKVVKSKNNPAGLFDIIHFPKLNKYYRITYSQNGAFRVYEINKDEANLKICKIIKKKVVSKDSYQLITNDGRSVITNNKAYKPKASIKINIEENSIKEYFPLEKGREVLIIGGKHIGQKAKILDVSKSTMIRPCLIKLEDQGVNFETTEKNVIVIN